MKKSSIIQFLLISTSTFLSLQEVKAEKSNLNNAYIGGHIGYMTTDTKSLISGAEEYGGGNNVKLSGHGINGGLHTGVGCFHGRDLRIYLGMEALATLSNTKTKEARTILDTISGGVRKLAHKHSFGAAVRVGALVAKSMPYIKAGFMLGHWEHTSVINVGVRPNPYAKTKKYLPGWLVGIGVDIPFNEKVVLGFEGTHCSYETFNPTHFNASTPHPYVKDLRYKIKPQTNTIQVRLSYRI
ncbi:MAG: outer membrane beta-barrel protein [Alphaproteobacteria bacterium]|nr:outer membrane beta-barrel protein [Alphaproteobacteria bacterium]